MSSENLSQKINLILCDLPPGITQSDIESFLSPYKSNFDSININEANPLRATVEFKDLDIANKCRHELNQKKLKNKNIRIMREEKNFLMKNKDTKNNLYVKNIPKGKDPRELYEYFLKFGDVFSLKVNENEKGEFTGTAFLTYYKEQDAKKCIEETNNKKIWDSDIEVNYQKNTHDKGYSHNNNYHNNYNNNYYNKSLKINISNLPENYTDKEVTKLCEEFGKFEICDIRKNKYGKFAIVKFSKEAEMKSAIEKLNNKSIEKNKLLVKEVHHSNNSHNNNYSNYNNNYYGKQRPTNLPFFYPNISMNINNIPMQKYEDTLINNNLYVTNIPQRATKEDFEKTFGQFGEIESTKLDEDTTITKDAKDKQQFFNKGFGYISFKKVEDAKKALESLDGKYIKGFENHYKRLSVEYFIPKDKRNPMTQGNFIQMSSGSVLYPNLPGQYMPQQYMVPIPMIPNNQMRMYNNKGGFKNMGYGNRRYNNNYKNRGNRANKNNQKRNNNTGNKNMNNKKEEEKKVEFDQETFDKLKTEEEKNEFLGEKIFNLIQENKIIKEKNADEEVIGKITGMILGIQNNEEIIDILKSPSRLEERIKEAYVLFEKNK
jgi:RNA recognition motif-containing protein